MGHRAQTRPGVGLRDNAPGRPPGAARRPAPAPGHMAAGSVTVSANPIIFATSRSFSLPGRPVSIFRGPAARVVEHRPIARLGLQPIFLFPVFLFSHVRFLFVFPLHPILPLSMEDLSNDIDQILFFVFCILYFVFCILYFVFCILHLREGLVG